MKLWTAFSCSLLFAATSKAVVIDLSFDMQTFDPIQAVATTEINHFAFNGATSAPNNFNTFTPHVSAMATQAGITLNMIGIVGSWSGNNTSAVVGNPLRAEF